VSKLPECIHKYTHKKEEGEEDIFVRGIQPKQRCPNKLILMKHTTPLNHFAVNKNKIFHTTSVPVCSAHNFNFHTITTEMLTICTFAQ
jgi:hypothetical protein